MINKELLQEHQKIISNFNLNYNNVGELLSAKVNENKQKIFLICPGKDSEQFTYSEFMTIVNQTSKFLIQSGLKKNDKISLIFHNSSEFLILYFAGLSYGLTIVPINPDLAPNEIKYIIEDSNSKHVFYNYTLESKIESIKKNLIDTKCIKIESINELVSSAVKEITFKQNEVQLSDIGVIIYTSGTTGNPKGVILNHLNLLSDAMSISNWFEFNKRLRSRS